MYGILNGKGIIIQEINREDIIHTTEAKGKIPVGDHYKKLEN